MAVPASHVSKGVPTPTVLVIGGTGFIGRHLTRALVAAGRDVRVLSRGGSGLFSDLVDRVETISVSLKDEAGLHAAMRGIDAVYDLAKSVDNTWEGALENDVLVTKRIGEAAIRAGVKRFIYTGSIASYDMSDPTRTITEQTGFAPDMSDRNIYARSKAACEEVLERLHREQGLPLVIARPGIVVGEGGPLQHWGLGRWHGAGAVRIWGNGHNILPFVLIEDCSAALVRILELEDATGRSFNLVGEPMLTARNYLDAIHERLGARIRVRSGSLLAFYLVDTVKYALKRYVLRKAGASHASLRDWQSRAHLSAFDNSQSKRLLHWQPEADRSRFVDRAIVEANLLGF